MFESMIDTERLFEHHTHMHRTYVRRRITALVVGVVVLGWGVPAAARTMSAGDHPSPGGTPYVVREGDTVWAVALRASPREDPRGMVDRILSLNRIEAGSLVPGQVIVIPSG